MKQPYLTIPAAVALLTSLSVFGDQPYVCRSNGKTVLTDQPCETFGNAKSAGGGAAIRSEKDTPPPPGAVMQSAPQPVRLSTPPKAVPKLTVPPKESQGSGYGTVFLLLGAAALVWFLRREPKEKPLVAGSVFDVDSEGLEAKEEVIPYVSAPLMSRYEIDMFSRLRAALPDHDVFPQVPLAAFIRIDRKKAGDAYMANSYRWQNRIGQQRVDYLVCKKTDLSVVAAVELDDPSHDREEAGLRDRKKSKSLSDAGVQLIRWRVEQMPSPQEIRGRFLSEDSAIVI